MIHKSNLWGQRTPIPAWVLFAAAFLITAGLYVLPHLLPSHIGTGYIVLYGGLTALSLMIWQRTDIPPKHVLWLGIGLVLFLYVLPPLTSNDSERYLWDGAVFLSGLDPYLIAPDAPEAASLRAYWPTPEEHSAYATLYPPGALTLFGLSALAGPLYGLWVWKALMSIAAITSLIIGYDLLRRRNALKALPLMAISPLLLFEVGAGYHLDIFCVLGLCTALWCLDREKIIWAGIIIGLAASIKFLPALIAGPLLFYIKPKQALKLFLGASLTWASIYIIMFGLGYKPLGLLPTFFEKWRGGAPLYPILEYFKTAIPLSQAQVFGLIVSLAVSGFAVAAYLAKKSHIIAAIMLTLSIPLLLSPVLFPWYLMIFVPLMALRPNLTLIAVIAISPLFYVVLNKWLSQGLWEPAAWASYLLLIAMIIGLIFDCIKAAT